jgi:hypothetical protein
MKFMGLALENSGNAGYVQYFLNASNHAPGVPIDGVTFHHCECGYAPSPPPPLPSNTYSTLPSPPSLPSLHCL